MAYSARIDDHDGPVLAELPAWTSVSEEFPNRWRAPGAIASRLWEERFGLTPASYITGVALSVDGGRRA